MTDEELIDYVADALDWPVPNTRRQMAKKFLQCATPKIERRLLEKMRNASDEMINAFYASEPCGKAMWNAMLDAFAKENGIDQ